jgi:tRNA-dihydrouridine synthase
VKKVLGRCRGGFHLSQPEVAIEILRTVRDHVPPEIPVTVKMRRGLDDSSESRDRFYQIFDAAWQIGVAAMTVHPRTVTQRYIGPSNWEVLREIKAHAGDRVVLGSGDLFDARACVGMMNFTGADGASIARGAIGNPWIFRQAQALAEGRAVAYPSVHEQRDIIAEHLSLAIEHYGQEKACRQMRKFGIHYADLHPHSPRVKAAFIKVSTREDWEAVLKEWYATDLPGCPPQVAEPNPLCA